MDKGFSFILPLQYNTKLISGDFVSNLDDHKFDGCFTYKGRMIWHKTIDSGIKGNKVYIYRDDKKKASPKSALYNKKRLVMDVQKM